MNEQVGLGSGTLVWYLMVGLGGGTCVWDLVVGLGGGTLCAAGLREASD